MSSTAYGSRKKAIDAKCKDCIYDECDVGTWRQQVAACTSYQCPLHSFRPLPAMSEKELRERYP
jgi:hypothetical protein